jgi:hypothetical protein
VHKKWARETQVIVKKQFFTEKRRGAATFLLATVLILSEWVMRKFHYIK